jgi:predicted DsbA family dithiol-disulfide isomerase
LDYGVEIEIFSDVVCPWCYLGKARLEAALADFDGEVNLRWRAFQLDPSTPREGRPLLTWLGAKFGGEERARQMMAHITITAAAAGLRLDFDRALIANSFDAHRLLWLADQPETVLFGATADTQPDLAEALHRAHFTDGLDIGSVDVLVDLADEVGLDRARVRDYLHSTSGVADVRAQIARAHDLGITSVPTFIFAGKYAVSGAQEIETFGAVLREVAQREGLAPATTPPIPNQRTAPATDGDSRVS